MNRVFPLKSPHLDGMNDLQTVLLKGDNILLLGDDNTCMTSLLFQSAVSFATEGCHVTFITQEPFVQMPLMVHGMPSPNPAVLKILKFLYMKSHEELVNYLATIHQKPVPPQVIIVDNLHHYTSQFVEDGAERGITKLCAMLVDAVTWLNQASDSGSSAHLLVSSVDKNKSHVPLYQRFIKNLYSIKKSEETFSPGVYNVTQVPVKDTEKVVTIRFEVKDSIFLKDILST